MRSGIYRIVNQVNGKFYIGSATNIASRWSTHRQSLRKGKHHSIHLQRAWDKYGEAAFVFEDLEEVDVSQLIEREQFYLDTLTPYVQTVGYNICTVANSQLGRKHTEATKQLIKQKLSGENSVFYGKSGAECPWFGTKRTQETLAKMSDAHSGSNNPMFGRYGKDNPKAKQVIQETLDGELVKIWDCLADVGRELGFVIGNISSCCNGRKRSSKGFIWRWAD